MSDPTMSDEPTMLDESTMSDHTMSSHTMSDHTMSNKSTTSDDEPKLSADEWFVWAQNLEQTAGAKVTCSELYEPIEGDNPPERAKPVAIRVTFQPDPCKPPDEVMPGQRLLHTVLRTIETVSEFANCCDFHGVHWKAVPPGLSKVEYDPAYEIEEEDPEQVTRITIFEKSLSDWNNARDRVRMRQMRLMFSWVGTDCR
ncbi:hypothetical protein V8F20_005963 [Naviculisporaceae sp. PSN 640]